MNKMHEIAGGGALMPRIDDGMVNMAELIRVMAESLVNKIMDTQADEACEAGNRPPTSGSMLPASRAAARAGRSRPRPGHIAGPKKRPHLHHVLLLFRLQCARSLPASSAETSFPPSSSLFATQKAAATSW